MNIIVRSLANYLKGLKFIFTPLGILFLAIVIGLSIAIPGIMNAVNSLINSVGEVLGQHQIDWSEIGGRFYNFFFNFNWKKPSAVSDLTDADYLTTLLNQLLHEVFPEAVITGEEIAALVKVCVRDIVRFIIIFIVVLVLGLISGHVITGMMVKRSLTNRKFRYVFIFAIVDTLVAVVAGILIYLSVSLGPWGLLLVLLILIAHAVFTFFEGWFIHARKEKIKIKHVLNPKNVGLLFLGNGIIFTISIIVIVLVALLNLLAFTIAFGLALMEVTLFTISSNAEAFVQYYSQKTHLKELEAKAK